MDADLVNTGGPPEQKWEGKLENDCCLMGVEEVMELGGIRSTRGNKGHYDGDVTVSKLQQHVTSLLFQYEDTWLWYVGENCNFPFLDGNPTCPW